MDFQKLKTILAGTHPKTGAYAADPTAAAQQIMEANVTVLASTVTGSQILNATDEAEFSARASTVGLRADWLNLCGIETIDIGAGVARALESKIFGPGTQTRANIQEVRKSVQSVAQIEGLGRVRPGHVEYARNLP